MRVWSTENRTLLLAGLLLVACGDDPGANTAGPATSGSITSVTSSMTSTVTTTGLGSMSSSGTSTSTSTSTTGAGGATSSVGGAQGSTGVAGSTTTDTTGSTTGGGAGGSGGAPAMLSETGLFTERGADQELVLAEGVREFEPRYWLWSDGSDKKRYVYLPPGTQIDTSDPDSWVLPAGAKLWKSFIANETDEGTGVPLLIETRLIERTGDGPDDYLFATYWWESADATDAVLMDPEQQLINAGPTSHDIPNGSHCQRCHGTSAERVLGFSALQLNHDLGGLNLETLMTEGWLTDPISLDIQMPGEDQQTQDALGYLHANCGNCHNDNPGIPLDAIPEPQMLLKVSVNDLTLEDTGFYQTALNQPGTASDHLALPYRFQGGSPEQSIAFHRMNLRYSEDQMPPLGTKLTDDDKLELMRSWIQALPPPSSQ